MASSALDMQKHLKIYYMIFGLLLFLTAATVLVAELDVNLALGITIALFVASVKGTFVACYFMHLLSERGLIYWILGLCALFFLVILLLPVITLHDNPMTHFVDGVSGQPN